MKRENIIEFVQDPSKLNQSSLNELEELLLTFPWFQTAHLLVAKNHHNLDSLKFHDILRDSAAYAGDRTVLYHLIHSPAARAGIPGMDESYRDSGDKISKTEELIQKLPEAERKTAGTDEIAYAGAYQVEDVEESSESAPIEEYTFTGWFDHFQTTIPEQPVKTEQQELIEKFIEGSPVIARGRDYTASQRDMSEESSKDSDSFMTETLATVYEKQGLYKKAIYAYEKLSLKYPEKSTYFATQINRLKSHLDKN
jgi:hypothetical protein